MKCASLRIYVVVIFNVDEELKAPSLEYLDFIPNKEGMCCEWIDEYQ